MMAALKNKNVSPFNKIWRHHFGYIYLFSSSNFSGVYNGVGERKPPTKDADWQSRWHGQTQQEILRPASLHPFR